jgi:hypothetical protein
MDRLRRELPHERDFARELGLRHQKLRHPDRA